MQMMYDLIMIFGWIQSFSISS